ncbi:hypothetical protein DAA51_31155 [Bradyrhizobium sp. WBAH10]|nr:hypothetical protein [Bradyrhizobium sp. WBAH30]MDD1542206.1 hypothetical protein [Bradyrhizobium sp. WBAH41]MDD1556358.1 hypothetical protein [Bradyrhizobium sp. WBAH23]MDD1561801.1 hypothetical protein [Bradyrhizobium sp. WBAH33]MDD1589177.1 hypothetical protein [Bradyrhizobium sp. WBAH42]NRB87675.1 hypothetical protein [Bradyrhizobium sp. WBAH10]QCJ92497.1 hypothetical protein DAA57_31400 [Bradyrhizobium yuanmingense]
MRMICLEQAQAASTELERNAFLEIAEQYRMAVETSAFLAAARRPSGAMNGVGGMESDLQARSRRFSEELRARAGSILLSLKSLLWLAVLVGAALFIAFYLPW